MNARSVAGLHRLLPLNNSFDLDLLISFRHGHRIVGARWIVDNLNL